VRDRRFAVLFSLAFTVLACSTEGDSREHLANGDAFVEAKQLDKALVEFRNAVQLDENSGEARLKLADAYAANGQPELAYREYIRAADLLPKDPQAQIKAAKFLVLARQYEDAVSRAKRAVDIAPQNVDARIALANALAGVRDLEGALTQIREAIAVDPARSQPYTALARLRSQQGQDDEARAAYADALRLEPNSIPAHLALANFQWSHGERENAEQTLKKAHALDPADVATNRVLATFYLGSGREDEAEHYLRTVADTSHAAADRLALADFYIRRQRFKEARELLIVVRADRAARNEADIRLSRVDETEGHAEAADDRLQRVLKRDPNFIPALLLRAERSIRAKKYEEALADANNAVSVNPRLLAPYYVRADAEMRLHREADAIKSYTEILRLEPGEVDAMVALSRLHLARNVIDSAVLYAEEAASAAPRNPNVRLTLVRAWVARGDDERAAAEVNELVKAPNPSAEVFVLDGSLRLKKGDSAGARRAFERALTLDPRSHEALATLTSIDVHERQFAAARARLEPVLQAEPDNAEFLALAAKVGLASGDLTTADTMLRRCAAHDARQMECFALLARLYQSQKRLDALVKEFDEQARKEPSNVEARLIAAVAVHTAGDVTGAQRRYEEILKIDSRVALAANNLAALLVERGTNISYAEHLATSAAEQMPTNGEVLDTLGSVFLKRSLSGQAVKYFQQAVALEPENAMFHYHLGQAYALSNDTERARGAFRTAIRLNAKFTAAHDALAALGR
jgi:putative PEP-CTERM system TPR-repeat lipoprotein